MLEIIIKHFFKQTLAREQNNLFLGEQLQGGLVNERQHSHQLQTSMLVVFLFLEADLLLKARLRNRSDSEKKDKEKRNQQSGQKDEIQMYEVMVR